MRLTRIHDPIFFFGFYFFSKFKKKKKRKKRKVENWLRRVRKKKSFYFPLYAFYFICNIQKKKKRENWHWPVRRKKKFEFWISKFKKKCGIYFFDFIFMSRDRAKPSTHWAEIPSQDYFKIQAFKPLSRDPSHWAMIRPSLWVEISSHRAEIQATEPLSRDSSHRAEIRAKPSWVKIFKLFFCN